MLNGSTGEPLPTTRSTLEDVMNDQMKPQTPVGGPAR